MNLLKKLDEFVIAHCNENAHKLSFILFAFIVLYFNQSWVPGMFMDGALYASLGKNMAESGISFVPFFTPGEFSEFFDHPPFFFIWEALLFKTFGVNWSVARLSGFIFNIFLVLGIWKFLLKYSRKEMAYYTLLCLCLTLPFIKKSRFPNLDIPLTFFGAMTFFSFYTAQNTNKTKYWLLTSISFGMALLTKGHGAAFIPLVIFSYLLFSKQVNELKNPKILLSFLGGLLIFCLWPLALSLNDKFYGFEKWFHFQFTQTVIEGRDREKFNFFTYLLFLLKYGAPWFYFAICESIFLIKEKRIEKINILFLVWFWIPLIALSLVKWKFSHYIIPIYPAMAYLSALNILRWKKNCRNYFLVFSKYLIILTSLVLLCFPVTSKIRREKELFSLLEITKYLKRKPKKIIDLNHAYGFWNLAANTTFATDIKVVRANTIDFNKIGADEIFLINKDSYQEMIKENSIWFKNYVPFLYLQHKNIVVIIDRKLINNDYPLYIK